MAMMMSMMIALNSTSDVDKNLAHDHAQVVPMTLFVAVLCLCLLIGHLLEESRWINESIVAIFVGCIAGMVILLITKGKSSRILTFNEEVFFIYLLPPIIFNAGFQVKKKQFFHNFLTIMLFGVIGVFISTSIITGGSWWLFPKLGFPYLTARDYLALGVIFSSTDTVCTLQVLNQEATPLLYSLVFGEGVVNDATSVVLFNAVQKLDVSKLDSKALRVIGDFLYLFVASTALGVIAGLVTAYILKALTFGKHSSVREISMMMLMAYLSYMLAELLEPSGILTVFFCGITMSHYAWHNLLELSGILTVFFCGITMSHYAWHNVTEISRTTTRHVFATMSFIAETFIFLYVGMDALDIEKWRMTHLRFGKLLGIYSCLIFLILLGRAAFVFPLSALVNYMNRRVEQTPSITLQHQIIIWWAGLIRGAVSIALAFKQFTFSGVTSDPVKATMITNTIIVVLFTTLVFGCVTKPLLRYLLPHHHARRVDKRHEGSRSPVADLNLPLLSFHESAETNISRAKESLSMLIESPVYTIHYYWRKFDDAYMRPIFGGPCSNPNPSEC